MNFPQGTLQRATAALTSLQVALTQAAKDEDDNIRNASDLLKTFLSQLAAAKAGTNDHIANSDAANTQAICNALQLLLPRYESDTLTFTSQLQDHLWLNIIPSSWRNYTDATNDKEREEAGALRDNAQKLSAGLVQVVIRYLSSRYDAAGTTGPQAMAAYELGAKGLIGLVADVLASESPEFLAFVGLPGRILLHSILFQLGESAKLGRALLRAKLPPEKLGRIWLRWTTYGESCDSLTLAWAIRPTNGNKKEIRKATLSHYRSFFSAYIEDASSKLAPEDRERKSNGVKQMVRLLADAKKADWDAILAEIHRQIGPFDVQTPQLVRATAIQSLEEASSTRWLDWPNSNPRGSHEIVVDTAWLLDWLDQKSNTSITLRIPLVSLRSIDVEEVRSSIAGRSATYHAFTLQLAKPLEVPLGSEGRLKVSISSRNELYLELGSILKVTLREEEGHRLQIVLRARDVKYTLRRKESRKVKMDLLPTAIDKLLTEDPPGHPASKIKASIAPSVTPPLSTVDDGDFNLRKEMPHSSRRNEIAQLAGIKVPTIVDGQDLTTRCHVSPARTFFDEESDLTDLTEDEAPLVDRTEERLVDDYLSLQGRVNEHKNKSTNRPASLLNESKIQSSNRTFRRSIRHKREREVNDMDVEESSQESVEKKRRKVLHSSKHSASVTGNSKGQKREGSPGRDSSVDGKSLRKKKASLSPDPDNSVMSPANATRAYASVDFLPPAPSPPTRSGKAAHKMKAKKRSTAEWMVGTGSDLGERHVVHSKGGDSTKSSPRIDAQVSASSTSDKSEKAWGSRHGPQAKTDKAGRSAIRAAKGFSEAVVADSAKIHPKTTVSRPEERNDQVDFSIDSLQSFGEDLAGVSNPRGISCTNTGSGKSIARESSRQRHGSGSLSPSQIALARQQSRNSQNLETSPAKYESRRSAGFPDYIPASASGETGEEEKHPTDDYKSEGYPSTPGVKVNSSALHGRGRRASFSPSGTTKPSDLPRKRRTREAAPTLPRGSSTANGADRRTALKENSSSSTMKMNLLKDKPPTKSEAFSGDVDEALILDHGFNIPFIERSKSGSQVDIDEVKPVPETPIERGDFEQLLVKAMNGLRDVYKDLAKSGFSEDIDDSEDPAYDQKSKAVLALEASARTTAKLGQFLYDLAHKKDQFERRKRDEINRRKLSDKVDVMSERLQGVLSEAGDVIQVLQSVDAWVNRHDRG